MSNGLGRVREVARRDKDARFTALLHHVTPGLLLRSFEGLKQDAAPGADGVTWRDYERGALPRLEALRDRVRPGRYRAVPSRRVYIPKADGRLRPLGIASLEDKVLQRAVCEVLNAVYETDFKGFSYGFRPGRSQHDALDALHAGLTRKRVNWVLDADIRGFFDHLDREWLVKFLRHRIADERVLRLVMKWLNAGVIEDGTWSDSGEGTPQGGSLSPLLANVYLHYVLDLWADWRRKTQARGNVVITRFADDFIVGFQYQDDAERFLAELRGRLAKFSLELHPDKTRLIEFGPHAARDRAARGEGKPETFTFLGFRHIARLTRGRFWIQRITDRKKMTVKLKSVKAELMRKRHLPVPGQGRWLASVITGHQAYYAVPGNAKAVGTFRHQVTRHWRHALSRRSQKGRVTWERMNRIASRYLPRTRTVHPWPDKRFAARYS